MSSFRVGWYVVMFIDGRLIEVESGVDINVNLPTFETVPEAEAYIEANDLRITIQ